MKKAWSINKLMKHMRDDHGFTDLRGSVRKLRFRNIGYFHGYKGYRYTRSANDMLPLSSFDELESIYEFDARLKAIFYPCVMEIETALKNVMLGRILEACSDPSLSTFCKEGLDDCRLPNGAVNKARVRANLELKATLQGVVRDSYKSPHISHYVNREGDVPMWSVFESMSLGNLSRLARCIRPDIENKALSDIGTPGAQQKSIADLIEVIRPLRNCIAHNSVIYDARFSQAVQYSGNEPVRKAGELVNSETSLGYAPHFNSIVDYMVLICMLMVYLTRRKSGARRFVKECREALASLKGNIGMSMYMKIVGSGDRQKLDAALRFVANR